MGFRSVKMYNTGNHEYVMCGLCIDTKTVFWVDVVVFCYLCVPPVHINSL